MQKDGESTGELPVLTNGNALIRPRNNEQGSVAATLHQPGHGRRPLQRQQARGTEWLWIAPMTVQQQAGQLTKQRLMGHQQLDLCHRAD